MKAISYMVLIEPEEMPGGKTASGLYLPSANIYDRGEDGERTETEWRPHKGTVLASCPGKFRHGMKGTGQFKATPDGKHVEMLDHAYHDWRMPEVGDEVYFGFKDWDPRMVEQDGTLWMDVARIFAVKPVGGEITGSGPWCVVEQIHDKVDEGPLITTLRVKKTLGIGWVKYFGDGFAESMPSVKPGMVVSFITTGIDNPIIPNPEGGENLTRLIPGWVVGVDPKGMTAGEIEERKAAAENNRKAVEQALAVTAVLGTETPEERTRRISGELAEKNEKFAAKQLRKHYHTPSRRWR